MSGNVLAELLHLLVRSLIIIGLNHKSFSRTVFLTSVLVVVLYQ